MKEYEKTAHLVPAFKEIFLLLLLAISLALSAPLQIYAETAAGTLRGLVQDSSGAAIPNAKVSVKNIVDEEKPVAEAKSAISGVNGTYAVRNLLPGTYEITVTAPGFIGATMRVTVVAKAVQSADFILMSNASGTANVPVVEVANAIPEGKPGQGAAAGGTMNSNAVGNLPLNGRSATDVAALEPGVLKTRTQATNSQYGFGLQLAVFGGRPRQNSSRLDGISVNDYANGPLGSAAGVALGVDAIDQLSVLTTNDQAQYGRSAGGYISSSTRSGTPAYHGSVFEYFQNTVFNARNYFDISPHPFHRNQFGATAGGSLSRKTFFFASYEGFRQSQSSTQVAVVPSEAAWAGNLSTGKVVVDAQIAPLENIYHVPDAGLLGAGDTGKYISQGIDTILGSHYVGRIDQKFSGKNSLYGVYVFDSGSNVGPEKLDNKLVDYDSQSKFVTFSETHTFNSDLVNAFRLGLYRMVSNGGATLPAQNLYESDTSLGAVPGYTVPWINVPGLVRVSGGLNGFAQYHFHWTSMQAYDDVSWKRGSHSFTFGADVERMRDNSFANDNPSGTVYFNSLPDFLTNHPFSFSVALPSALSERGFRQTVAGAYVQDDWLVRPHLTLDLGLRYETATVPNEVQGKLSSLTNLTDAAPHLGSPLFSNPTRRNFEPRVGFAWDPFHKGWLLVSSSFGIFDALPLPYEIEMGELFAAPYFLNANATNLPAGAYQTGTNAVTNLKSAYNLALAAKSGFSQTYFEPHPHRNYIMQDNFTTQWQLPSRFSMKLGYVGSRGVHNIFRDNDANIVLPTLTPQGYYLWPSSIGRGVRLNPNAGSITASFWDGSSDYNALALQVTKAIGGSSQVAGSYTWGRSIDTGSGSIEGDEYTNAVSSPLWFNPKLNRGESDFDIAKDLKVIYSLELPNPKLPSSLATHLVGGWRLGGVLEMSTGVPFTPGIGGDPLGLNSTDTNVDVPNVLSGSECKSLVNPGNYSHYIKTQCFAVPSPITLRGNLGRNRLIGPGERNIDFSLFKNNYVRRISDTFNVQFRTEIFNLFNHPGILAPLYNRNIFDSKGNPVANGGTCDTTDTLPRAVQFALRFIW